MAGAVVQVKEASNAAAGTTLASGSLVSNVTSGNFLYIVANAGDNQTITITQNSGTATLGTITSRGSVQEAGVLDKLEHFTCEVTGSGTLDVLATFGASTDRRGIVVVEVSGVSAYDVGEEETDTGSNPTRDVTVSVTAQPALGLSFCTLYQGGTPTAGSGWTSHTSVWSGVSNGLLQTKAITATGSLTANFGNASVDRNNAAMVVFTEPAPPVVTAQPVQQTASVGATATFTVTATGVTTYQWQTAPDGETWSNVGTNSSSYTTGTLASSDNGTHVRCQLTNGAGTTNTVTVRLFIRDLAITGKGSKLDTAWPVRARRRGGNAFNLLRKQIQPGDVNGAEKTVFDNWWWSSGTAYTLAADGSTYSLTGAAATPRKTSLVSAAAGSYALTGVAAGLYRGYPMVAAGGVYTLTGTAATLAATRLLAAASGALALTGTAAALVRGLRLSAEAGSYALSGQAAGMLRGYPLTAASGAYALSGADATLRVTRRLVADAGALTLTGAAAGLSASRRVSAESGALTLTGADADLIYTPVGSYLLVADSGSLALTGAAAGLRVNRRLDASAGAMSLTGLAAGLRVGRVLTASAGSHAISGSAATLTYSGAAGNPLQSSFFQFF